MLRTVILAIPPVGSYTLGMPKSVTRLVPKGPSVPGASRRQQYSASTKRALVDMQLQAFSHTRILMNNGGSDNDTFIYALKQSPRIGIRNSRVAFLHPKSTGGVLTEIVEPAH